MNEPSLLDLVYSAHRRLAELESQARDYGTGEALFASEVHTLVAVARLEGGNLTELAGNLGVSVPAAFKFAAKMVKREYLTRRPREGNAKEICFFLTGKGRQVVSAHAAFEQTLFSPMRRLEEQLSQSDRTVVKGFLAALNEACTW